MDIPQKPDNEASRVASLCGLAILDTPPEERFDRISRIAQHHFKVPIALVSLVDSERQWFKSRQGLEAVETSRDISFCGHAILSGDIFYVPDTLNDPRFDDNPLVTGAPYIRFYTGAPLHSPEGYRVGTLCLIDSRPREFSAQELTILRDLADTVEDELGRVHLLKVQQELAVKEAQLQNLVRLSPGVIYTGYADGNYGLTYISDHVEQLLGFPPEKFLSTPQFWLECIHPEDKTRFLQNININTEQPISTDEYRFKTAAGRFLWLHDKRHFILDEKDNSLRFIGLWIDVTERKEAEQRLRESESKIRAIVENVIDGIITINEQGMILTMNLAAEEIFGYRSEEAVGENIKLFMPSMFAKEHDSYLANYMATGKKKIIGVGREVVGQRKNGTTFPMELAVSDMIIDENHIFTGIVRDITERKKTEQMKDEFVSTVSHELRTPLTSIRGALGLVLGKSADELSDKNRAMIEMANRNCERLTLLINDILDLEKIESGNLELAFKVVDLDLIAKQAVYYNQGFAQRHGVTLVLSKSVPQALVLGDENSLLQVFSNLISNAIKFSEQDASVEVVVDRNGGNYRVSVRDYGQGIPNEFKSRIFQRFAQADGSDTRAIGGTGLGLSICKSIINKHSSNINFHSQIGEGTEFFFELPSVGERYGEIDSINEIELVADKKPAILHVEDDLDIVQVTKNLIGDIATFSSASTIYGAKQLLKEKKFDLIILDLTLNDGSGEVLLDQLHNHCPVVIFSVYVPARLARRAAAVMIKSLTSNHELRKTIQDLLIRK